VLRDCIIPAPQLAPLLSGVPITCVRLEGNSDLSGGRSAAGQGLLDLLSLSPSLTSLELTGVTHHFRPPAPGAEAQEGGNTASQLPPLSPSLKRLSLRQSGSLNTWAHVITRLPSLECLEVSAPPVAVEDISYLPEVAPSFMCLRTLNLPKAFISQGQDGAVLRVLLQLPVLEHVQVCETHAWVFSVTITRVCNMQDWLLPCLPHMQLHGIDAHNSSITQDSMPSSVPWQTLRLHNLNISAARLLPPSALAALTGPSRLFIGSFPATTHLMAIPARQFASRLADADAIRAQRGLPPLLEQCTLHVYMSPSPGDAAGPPAGHEFLQAWANLIFHLTPATSSLSIPSVCLLGLSAAMPGPALDMSEAMALADSLPDAHPRLHECLQQGGTSVVGALLADAFPKLHTLELRTCHISPDHLAPLVSTAPLTCLKLTQRTRLGSPPKGSLQALCGILSKGSIDHLEVEDSLWGAVEPSNQLWPPSLPRSPPSQLQLLRHVKLHNCGSLERLVPLLRLMPNLTHLEVSHHPFMDQQCLGYPLKQLLPSMPHLRTLLLPNSSGYGLLDLSLLKAGGSLRHVEVGTSAAACQRWTPA
jgi:hypothetical protein